MNFGQRIKQLRKEHKLRQEDLAKLISKTRSAVAGWEAEGKEPDHETLTLLSNIFNVSIDFLLGKDEAQEELDSSESDNIEQEYKEALDYLEQFVIEMKNRGYDYSDKSREELANLFVKLLRATDIIKEDKL
jgi:transcriptional regulator with XRE-family HTH domain